MRAVVAGPVIASTGAECTLCKRWKSASTFCMMSSAAIDAQHSVTGFNARSNEAVCCVHLKISSNWKELITFPVNCHVSFLITFQITESPIVLSSVDVSQEMLYGSTPLALCSREEGGKTEGGVTPSLLFHHRCLLFTPPQFSHIYFSPLSPPLFKYHVIILKWRHMRAPTYRNMAAGLTAQTQMTVRRVVASWRQGVVLQTTTPRFSLWR